MTVTTTPTGAACRRAATGSCPSPVTGQELVLIGVIAVIWVVLAFATPAFLTAGSIQPLLVATAPIALVGVGMTIVIITGGIDVSVGGAIMVCSVLTAKQLVAGLSLPVAVLLAIAVGGVLGLVNGLLIAYGRVHAIIITFGTREHLPVPRPADLRLAARSTASRRPSRSSAAATRGARSASRTRSRSPC